MLRKYLLAPMLLSLACLLTTTDFVHAQRHNYYHRNNWNVNRVHSGWYGHPYGGYRTGWYGRYYGNRYGYYGGWYGYPYPNYVYSNYYWPGWYGGYNYVNFVPRFGLWAW